MNKKLLFLLTCFLMLSLKYSGAQVLFSEPFSSGTLPAGWTNDSLGLPAAHLWVFDNPFSRSITGANFDANFAMFDSDESLTNDSIPELATLTSPSIDITGASGTLFLEMDEQFRSLAPPTGEAKRHIEYSIDNGLNWLTLVYDSLDYGYPTAVHSTYNITALIGTTNNILVRFTWTGDWDWWWAIDNVEITTYAACSAPPVAGTTVSTMMSVCPDDVFDLSLVGADNSPDLTFQWQSSPDGSTWTDIPGATGTTWTTSQSAETYYQCIVTCTGTDAASTPVQVTMNSGTACYCVPLGISCSGLTGAITNVSITGTTMNHNSACDELTDIGYTIWPYSASASADLVRGTAYDFSVTTDGDNIISIWIDYDMNGGFEASEWKQVCTTSSANVANTVNIMIPMSANVGPTRMRVRARDSGSPNDSVSSCIQFFSGESEDYVVGLDYNVGISQVPVKGTVIYPNPTNGLTYLFFEKAISSGTLSVYDMTGRMLQNKELINVFSSTVDLSSETNGIYFVRIVTSEGSTTNKIILNR